MFSFMSKIHLSFFTPWNTVNSKTILTCSLCMHEQCISGTPSYLQVPGTRLGMILWSTGSPSHAGTPVGAYTVVFVFATPCLCLYNWQWQVGVIAILLSWIGLVSFLQKWPVTGVYILMFINTIQSFLKIGFLAVLLVIAFGLAFYMLFFEPDEMVSVLCIPEQSDCSVCSSSWS